MKKRGKGRPKFLKDPVRVVTMLDRTHVTYVDRYAKKHGLLSRASGIRKIIDQHKRRAK